jgi:hypothetical protein
MSKRAINSPATTLDDEQWSDYVNAHRERRAHPQPVTLTGEQVHQISSIIGQACEVIHCAQMLYEFPEEWDRTLRSIRSTAGTIRYFAKAPKARPQLTEADTAMLQLKHIVNDIPRTRALKRQRTEPPDH